MQKARKANKKLLTAITVALLLSSCSFQANYDVKHKTDDNGYNAYSKVDGDNRERFLSSFTTNLTDGFAFVIDEAECRLGKNFNNILSIKEPYKATGEFKVNGLSLHQVEFDVNLPIDYNGLVRGLQLTLADENLYMAIYSQDDATSYDFKYRVSVAPYDTVDENGNSMDDVTGGTYRYEYGDLDWVIDDILESLSDKFLKVGEEKRKSSFTFDAKEVIDSLENMEEGVLNNAPYFVWNLPIGEKTFNLGLRADPLTYQLTGIDFPSKSQGGYYDISSDTKIKASISVLTGEVTDISAPSDANAYTSLVDSMAIWHKVIDYANAQKFSVQTRGEGLLLTHVEEAFEGDGTFFGTEEINETARLSLRADIDVTDNDLQSLYCDVDYSFGGLHQVINGMMNGSATDAFDEVYMAINDLQKAKTSKTVLDSMVGSLKDLIDNMSGESSSKKSSGGGLAALGGKLTDAINAVKNSSGMENITDENYEDLMGAITVFRGSMDDIVVTLDLTVFGMEGTITLHLIGDESNLSVGYLKFDNVSVDPFTVSGEIDVIPYERTPMSDEEKAKYVELRHLESLSDQFVKISETKQVKLGVEGYVLKKDTTSVATNKVVGNKTNVPNNQGFTFKGTVGFNGNENQSTGSITIVDRKETYVNDHNVMFDITGKEPKDDNGDCTQTDSQVYTSNDPSTKWMLFEYNSKNASGYASSENRTQPSSSSGLKGRFAMHSVTGMLDVIETLFGSDDPRLDRITGLITNMFINSVIGDLITGKYYKVIGSDLITSITLGAKQDVFEMPASLLGGEAAMKIIVNYKSDVTKSDGRVVGGEIESLEVELSFGESNVYAKIDVLGYQMQAMNFVSNSITDFTNYSSLKTFAEYATNMFLVGDKVTTSSGKEVIRSSYRIEGTASAKVLGISFNITFKVFVRVEGADIKIVAYLTIPEVTGATTNFYLGTRYVNMVYHTSGNNDDYLMIDRFDERKTADDKHYQTKIKPSTLKNTNYSLMDYILADGMGLTDSILNSINTSSSDTEQALHAEDLITGFSFNNNLSSPEWYLDLHTAALLHNDTIGDIKLTLAGTNAGGKNLFYSAKTRSPIEISILDINFNAQITNFTDNSNGYRYCWNDSVSNVAYKLGTKKVLWVKYDIIEFTTYNNNSFYDKIMSDFASLPVNPKPSNHL